MKKALTVLLILAIACTAVFAETQKKDFRFIVSGGTSLFDSHVAFGVDIGRLNATGTVYTGFPNAAIASLVNGSEENVFKLLLQSFVLGVGFTGSCTYDLIPSDKFDLDLGGSACAMYMPFLEILKVHGIIGATVSLRMSWNINERSSIYIGSELPIAGVIISSAKDSNTGEDVIRYDFQTVVTQPDMLMASFAAAAYFAKIGYEYHF